MHQPWSMLLVFLFGHPHLLEGAQCGKDTATCRHTHAQFTAAHTNTRVWLHFWRGVGGIAVCPGCILLVSALLHGCTPEVESMKVQLESCC